MSRGASQINRTRAGLIVIDIQERLLPAIFEKERVLENSLRLIHGAKILGLQVVATEQYRKGLGQTVSQIAQAFDRFAPLEKLAFSACGAEGWDSALQSPAVSELILCGIEAHVCVAQTCLDLLESGRRVFVAADAVSSRTAANYRFGLERMRDAGAVIVSTEMILFELLERAGTDEFKRVLALLK